MRDTGSTPPRRALSTCFAMDSDTRVGPKYIFFIFCSKLFPRKGPDQYVSRRSVDVDFSLSPSHTDFSRFFP
jgi:hypothetical protein